MPVEDFFAAFSAAAAAEDWPRFDDMFLTPFPNADPAPAGPVVRDDLLASLPHRKGIFERVGATGTAPASLVIHHLDERHVLAGTTWTVDVEPDRRPVEPPVLRSTFLLRVEDRGVSRCTSTTMTCAGCRALPGVERSRELVDTCGMRHLSTRVRVGLDRRLLGQRPKRSFSTATTGQAPSVQLDITV